MVVVTISPLAPVELWGACGCQSVFAGKRCNTYTSTDVNTEVDVLVGLLEDVSPPFSVITVLRGAVVEVSAGWGVGVACGGVVDC